MWRLGFQSACSPDLPEKIKNQRCYKVVFFFGSLCRLCITLSKRKKRLSKPFHWFVQHKHPCQEIMSTFVTLSRVWRIFTSGNILAAPTHIFPGGCFVFFFTRVLHASCRTPGIIIYRLCVKCIGSEVRVLLPL